MLPVEIYPRVMQAIELISQGFSITAACDKTGMNYATFKKYVTSGEEIAKVLEAAEQRGEDALAELLLNIDNDPRQSRPDAKMANVISSNIKWYLAHRKPEKFGNAVTVTHNITADKAVVEALAAARIRAEQAAKVLTIEDATYEVIDTVAGDTVDAWAAVGLPRPKANP